MRKPVALSRAGTVRNESDSPGTTIPTSDSMDSCQKALNGSHHGPAKGGLQIFAMSFENAHQLCHVPDDSGYGKFDQDSSIAVTTVPWSGR